MWNFLRPTLLAIPFRKYTHHIVTVFTLTKECPNIFLKEKSLWPIIWIYSSHSFLQPITIDMKIKIRKVSENMHNVFRIFVFPPGPDRRWWKRFPQLTWCASPFSESRKPDIINLYLGAQSSFSSMNCNQNNVRRFCILYSYHNNIFGKFTWVSSSMLITEQWRKALLSTWTLRKDFYVKSRERLKILEWLVRTPNVVGLNIL